MVPVKDFAHAKSRVVGLPPRLRRNLARALAMDTVETVCAAVGPQACFVVSSAAGCAGIRHLGVNLVREPYERGLNAALSAGRDAAISCGYRAVAMVVADLPLLTSQDLEAALADVPSRGTVVVRDASGAGSTLLASRSGALIEAAFGGASAARHVRLGVLDHTLMAATSLRFDLDTMSDVEALRARGGDAGPRTMRWLREASSALDGTNVSGVGLAHSTSRRCATG
ncbi:2-phospho-L-lactate guanylyltransferase [Knoellia aerolata DSM 18566]|uniref:2-phospho-L-lactate guanylyltransferase n=1 Tax=Knoellia aerolata DSM 18566 TaxID=1385519 RepID=A0A0A0JZT6_9MICO|nr:2-phospho-L-lactate guanylyltransferase [Knoellia aerolata DSM 18566]